MSNAKRELERIISFTKWKKAEGGVMWKSEIRFLSRQEIIYSERWKSLSIICLELQVVFGIRSKELSVLQSTHSVNCRSRVLQLCKLFFAVPNSGFSDVFSRLCMVFLSLHVRASFDLLSTIGTPHRIRKISRLNKMPENCWKQNDSPLTDLSLP